MVDPKPGKPVAKAAVKPAAAKPTAKPAAASVAAKSAAPVKVAAPVKPAPVAKAPAAKAEPVPVAAKVTTPPKAAATPAKPVAAAPVEAAKLPTKVAEVPAKAAEVTAEIVTKAVEAPVKVAEKVAEATVSVVENTAAPAVAAEPITKSAVTPPQKGFFAMTETVSPTFVPTPESFQALLGDVSTRAKAAFENSAKLAEEVGEFTKGNVEALLASSRVAAKGAETLGQEAASYSKKSLESATAAFKGFAAAKSPTELFKLQSDYARSSFDAAVAEGSKFSEAMMKLIGEITQPISTRVALAAEKIKTPAF
jgi:phasin family protein